jgi:hypothetical protein
MAAGGYTEHPERCQPRDLPSIRAIDGHVALAIKTRRTVSCRSQTRVRP